MRLFFVLGMVIFHRKIELRKLLKIWARYATMNTREGVGGGALGADFGTQKGRKVASQSRKTR